jgi:hypothetical protein
MASGNYGSSDDNDYRSRNYVNNGQAEYNDFDCRCDNHDCRRINNYNDKCSFNDYNYDRRLKHYDNIGFVGKRSAASSQRPCL